MGEGGKTQHLQRIFPPGDLKRGLRGKIFRLNGKKYGLNLSKRIFYPPPKGRGKLRVFCFPGIKAPKFPPKIGEVRDPKSAPKIGETPKGYKES